MVTRWSLAGTVIALGIGAGWAEAQQTGPDVFGTQDEGITIVGYQDFFPHSGSVTYSDLNNGERVSGGGSLLTGLNMLPNGVLITQLAFYVRDDDASSDFSGRLCRSFVHSASGQANFFDCGDSLATDGQPGETVVFTSYNPPIPILYRQDIDGDSFADVVNYYLLSSFGDHPTDDVAIRMARVRWKRQVSPAPAVATFNDVPTNHQFFQFVEALSVSGITAGCSASPPLYCPDAPLTRGQMAAFLAKALGLHWPWNAAP